MSDETFIKPSKLFWVFAALFLIWGLMGCGIYLVEVTMSDAAYAEAFGPELAAVRDVHPTWAIAAYATAVWSGLLAAILFILRKRLSPVFFMLSLVTAIIGFIPTFTNSTLRDAAGSSFWVMPLIVVCIGIFEVTFSRKQQANGILR